MKKQTYLKSIYRLFLVSLCLMTMGVGEMWGWDWPANTTIYFDKQNCTGFGTPYFRLGRAGNNFGGYNKKEEMTLVAGTKYLYSYTQESKWDNYGAFSVANNFGWTDENTIYQPYYNDGVYPTDNVITKQTNFQKYEVTSDVYLKITANGDNSNNCQYYQVNGYTNNSGDGELVSLPTYSITYNSSPSNGSVAVYQYNGSDYNTSLSSGTNTLKPTQLIKIVTTPATHYALATLTVTGATADPDGDGSTYYITGNCEITATFAPRWNIKGSMSDDDWATFYPLDFKTGSGYSAEFTLAAHTAYRFKVYDRRTANNGRYFGCSTRDHDYTYVGQTEEVPLSASGNALMLMTTVGGKYTFNWDSTAKTLQIVYPTTIKHPSMDYVYMEKYNNWNSGVYCYLHNWYNDGSNHNLTDGSVDPKIKTSTPVKHEWTGLGYDTAFYTFPILTTYPKFKAAEFLNGSGGDYSHATSEMEVTDARKGHYVYYDMKLKEWTWHTIQIYIQLENAGADEGKKGTLGWNVAFNDTALTTAISKPQKSHYDFGGYYTAAEGGGVQIIDANGDWVANVSDYTSSGVWIHAGDTTKLYAKWTKHPYAINLAVSPNHVADSDPATGGTIKIDGVVKTSMNAYQDSASVEITAVPAVGYKFKEWQFSKTGEVYDVYVDGSPYSSITNPVKIRAGHDGTLTAVFEPRFELVGSKDATEDPKGGMPGWSYDGTGAFAVLSSSPSVNLTCTCSLEANTRYKFMIRDRAEAKNYGDGKDGQFLLIETNRAHCENLNMNMKFQTTGAAKYVFQIDSIDENNRPYVKILWPRQVNFGWKYVNADEPNSKKEGGGGTVTAYVHEGGVKTAVSNGGYIMQGSTVSFTAHPYNDYNFAGWWSDYSYSSDKPFATADSTWWPVTTSNANGYAKYVEKTDTLKSGTTWSGGTWSTGYQPTADIVAVIKSPVEVDITTAKAKKVLIMQNSPNTGQLEIPAGKELVVRTTIKKTTDGSTYGATGENDIIIGSTLAEGNGALVMGAHDGTNKATVYFATKAKTTGEGENKHNVNQFIGTPFNDENDILYDYYGTKIYEFKAAHDGDKGTYNEWQRVASTGQKMLGFKGYNILTNQTESPVLEMTGQLSRTNTTETIDGYYNGSSNTENMFANSWVAPIYIPNFENDDFTNIEKTIYIFNAGTPADQSGHAIDAGDAETTAAGQYCVVPVKAAEYTGLKIIPSMQAFSVFASGTSPSLKFNYTRLVYNPANGTATIVPNRAPRRTAEEDSDAPTVLRLAATGESGYTAKIVLLERTGFTDNFDDGWDGRFLAGDDAAPQLYAVTPDGNMAINSIPNIEGTLLGFKAGEADDLFTFSFDYDGEALYLYDTQLQTYTRVMTGNTYAFTTTDNAAHNRFILTRNAPSVVTGLEDVDNASQVSNKMIIDNHLYIFRGGVLYDAMGRIIK